MEKLLKLFFVLTCIAISLASCEQSNTETPNLANEKMGTVSFKYNGKSYHSEYQTDGKIITYSNEEVKEVIEELSNKPNLATYINENGQIEYFNDYESLKSILPQNTSVSTTTKAGGQTIASLSIYANTNYKGSSKTFQATDTGTGAYYTNLSAIGFSKNISSLKLNANPPYIGINAVHVTLWDQIGFKGHSITWNIDSRQQTQNIPDLGKYILQIPGITTWNDVAQSLQFGNRTL